MKRKAKYSVPDSIVIDSEDSFAFEQESYENIQLVRKDKNGFLIFSLLCALIFRIASYIVVLVLNKPLNLYLFITLLLMAWVMLIAARLKKAKNIFVKALASLFIVFIILDLAVLIYFIK